MDDNLYSGKWFAYNIKGEELLVSPVCSDCHRFIKMGTVWVNGFEETKYTGFICKTHGEIEPDICWGGDLN